MPEPRRKRPPSADPRYKLTDARIEAILAALRGGCTRRAAAAVGQISPTTFYEWMANDRTLVDSVERAEAEAEAMFTAAVSRAAQDPKTWTAAAWWLERRKYQDYARRDKVEMTVDLRKEAEALAGELGLDPAAVMAELDGILKASR